MYRLRIRLEGLPALQSGAFGHWRARRSHDSKWKTIVAWSVVGKKPPKPLERALVFCTRFSAARQAPDADNLAASFKPLIDGLTLNAIIRDDSPEVIAVEYFWVRCPRGEGHIVIEVSDATESSVPNETDSLVV